MSWQLRWRTDIWAPGRRGRARRLCAARDCSKYGGHRIEWAMDVRRWAVDVTFAAIRFTSRGLPDCLFLPGLSWFYGTSER
jgi:hypothetical protein